MHVPWAWALTLQAPHRVGDAETDQQQTRGRSRGDARSVCSSSRPEQHARAAQAPPTPSRGRDRTRRSSASCAARTSVPRGPARRTAPSDPAPACGPTPMLTAAATSVSVTVIPTAPAPATPRTARRARPIPSSHRTQCAIPSPVRADTISIAGRWHDRGEVLSIGLDSTRPAAAAAGRSSSAAPDRPSETSSDT